MKYKVMKYVRGMVTTILITIMCLGSAVPALATSVLIEGNEEAPAQPVITKKLIMPEGTTTPGATFTFTFKKISVDSKAVASDSNAMPAIGPVTIDFAAGDTGDILDGVKTVTRQSTDALTGVSFPHAGVYEYEVTEEPSVTNYLPGSNETFTFTAAKYSVIFYVENGANQLYTAKIEQKILINDVENQETSVNTKVDSMVFTNPYLKQGGGEDPTIVDNQALTISKAVTGSYANRSKYFAFNITATQPATVTGQTYKAYVLDESGSVVTSTDNYAVLSADSYGQYIVVTSGSSLTVNLKHGQKLVFNDLHIGSTYVAVERAEEHYKASVVVTVNGGDTTLSNSAANTSLSTETRRIGEGQNSAAFTNTNRDISATGVLINNLPFIIILLLAAGALAGFIVVKSRKKNHRISRR